MALLIDTNILIAYERGQIDVDSHVQGREDELFSLSVISASELLHGVQRAQDPATRARRLAFVEAVLARFPMIEIDLAVARIHAEIWSALAAGGQMIGVHDSWIAATCIAHDFTLITANLREFHRVPGLHVENWLNNEGGMGDEQ
jgi:tRNA(fMet)-specific endonuclease VapC